MIGLVLALALTSSAKDLKEIAVGDTVTIQKDIVTPFKKHRVVAILGSSRLDAKTQTYDLTSKVASAFAAKGYAVVTGGGPGIMDAANRAASKAGVPSIGFDTVSFWPRQPMTYLDGLYIFSDLQLRKRALMQTAELFVILPGGIGTLDELFTILGAQYSEQLSAKPIVLVDRKFWQPLMAYLGTTLVNGYKTADQKTVDLLHLVDTPEEAVAFAH